MNDWYDNTLLSRLNDKSNGCIVILMQRLHQWDLVGHVLEQAPWDLLSFAATTEYERFLIESPLGWQRFERRAGDFPEPSMTITSIPRRRRRTT